MTQKEARRIAMLVIASEVQALVDVSDEWDRHPETDKLFAEADVVKIKHQARRFVRRTERTWGSK